MAIVLADRVKETTTTTGTGTLTLAGAVSGFQSFAAIGNTNETFYCIVSGTDWEVGQGTYTASGTTFSRDTVFASSAGGAKISVVSGAEVFATYPADSAITNRHLHTDQIFSGDQPDGIVIDYDHPFARISVETGDGIRMYTGGVASTQIAEFKSNGDTDLTGVLTVGGGSLIGGATNPQVAASGSANNYVQLYVHNDLAGTSASADLIAYPDNGTDLHGYVDLGCNSSTFNDANYSVTGPNESYLLASAPSGAGASGNMVYVTDSTGTANAHQWYVGGFNQPKDAWSMQLLPGDLELKANGTVVGYDIANASAKSHSAMSATDFNSYSEVSYQAIGTTGGTSEASAVTAATGTPGATGGAEAFTSYTTYHNMNGVVQGYQSLQVGVDGSSAVLRLGDNPLRIFSNMTGALCVGYNYSCATMLGPTWDTASAGTAGYVYTSNGPNAPASWQPAGGAGGSPGGNSGEIQYNNAGAFAGAASVEVENGQLRLISGAIPATPAAGGLNLFSRSRAGRHLAHIIGPSGVDVALQPALFGNSIYMWLPGTGTTVAINFGCSFTARNSGTSAAQAHPARASTNAMSSLVRATFGTGTTATGASGIQSAATVAWRGNAANLGGFFFSARFGIETLAADMRAFVGLSANNAAMAADASTWNNTIGIAKDSADSVWQVVCRGTAVTKTPTGCTVTAGQILDMFLFAAPNGSDITVRLVDAVSGTVYVDNVAFTTNIPAATTFLYMQAHTQSVTGTTAKLLALNRMYCETDL